MPAAVPLPDIPFLHNSQGWEFFLEALEFSPGHWRGILRINTGSTGLTSRLRCVDSRATEAEGLQDAKNLAWVAFDKVAQMTRKNSELACRHTSSFPQ